MAMDDRWKSKLERRIRRWCSREGLGTTWVVAVSGGGDSVGLLRVLHELAPRAGLQLSVAHLDHGARGEASRADAAFVADLAASLGLQCSLGEWQPTRSGHFEADARRVRYAFLTDVARLRGASVVAVGHTRDDQAETILHRIIRGTGIRGLAGMPPKRPLAEGAKVTLARPLLDVTRQQLRDFLAGLAQPFRQDESNADLTRTRVRIRHDLLPKLAAEYNPQVASALVRLGTLAAAMERSLEADIDEMKRAVVIKSAATGVVLKSGFLASMPRHLRAEVLRRIWRDLGWPEAGMTARRWLRLARLAEKETVPRTMIGAHVEAATEQFFLVLRRVEAPLPVTEVQPPAGTIKLPLPGEVSIPWANGRVIATLDAHAPRDELIDLDALSKPLFIRSPMPGDRFEPLGMGGKSTPLADFLRNRRIPRGRRARQPLVCDQRGIIWVVGQRIADRVKITAQTKSTVSFRWVGDK
jgi:tRNA(Ile)-lysidine synthase